MFDLQGPPLVNGAVLAIIIAAFVLLARMASRAGASRGGHAFFTVALSSGWVLLVYAAAPLANSVFLGRVETVFGDPHAPIGHGYDLVYPHGNWGEYTLQKEQSAPTAEPPQSEIRRLQVADPFVFADADDTFKQLDMRNGQQQQFSSEGDLVRSASAAGVRLRLEPTETVFERYHDTWFDHIAPWVAWPGAGLLLLWHIARAVLRRRSGEGL